jgi:hypothetical protein
MSDGEPTMRYTHARSVDEFEADLNNFDLEVNGAIEEAMRGDPPSEAEVDQLERDLNGLMEEGGDVIGDDVSPRNDAIAARIRGLSRQLDQLRRDARGKTAPPPMHKVSHSQATKVAASNSIATKVGRAPLSRK